MAGSINVTKTDLGGSLTEYSIAWTSDASGNVNANTFDIRRGQLFAIKFVPGSPTPTNNYVAKLLDPDSVDLLNNTGAALSSTTGVYASPAIGGVPILIKGYSAVTPTVSGAGVSTQGTIVVTVGP